jgi:hypothetical protein
VGRGRLEPEEELEFFFPEVEADAGGVEEARGHLLAHLMDRLDDLDGRERTGHHAGGEEPEVDRLHRERHGRRSRPSVDGTFGSEVLEDPKAATSGRVVAIPFDALSVAVPSGGDGPKELHDDGISNQVYPLSVISARRATVRKPVIGPDGYWMP